MIDVYFSNTKGQYGLGIMIIEGKHAEVGQGIFISDIQEGSAAEQVGNNTIALHFSNDRLHSLRHTWLER